MGQIEVVNCTALTARRATLYFQTPPFTQATLVDLSPDGLTWTIQVRPVCVPGNTDCM